MTLFKHLIAGLSLLMGAAAAVAAPLTPAEQEAAAVAKLYAERVHETLAQCERRYAGKGGEYFSLGRLLWNKRNEQMTARVNAVWPSVPQPVRKAAVDTVWTALPDVLRPPADIAPRTLHTRCSTVGKQVESRTLDVATVHPAATALLGRDVAERDRWKLADRNADFTIGCMKQGWNIGGRDPAALLAQCECQTAVLLRSATDAEIDAFTDDMAANPQAQEAVMKRTPWMVNALPAIAACKSPAAGAGAR